MVIRNCSKHPDLDTGINYLVTAKNGVLKSQRKETGQSLASAFMHDGISDLCYNEITSVQVCFVGRP